MMNNYEEQLKEQLKIIDKDNRSLQQENIYLREKCKELQIIVKEAIEYIENDNIQNTYGEINASYMKKSYNELLDIVNKAIGDE